MAIVDPFKPHRPDIGSSAAGATPAQSDFKPARPTPQAGGGIVDPFKITRPALGATAPSNEAPKIQQPKGFTRSFGQGFERSLPENKSLLYGAAAAAGGAVGADSVRDWGVENYKRVQDAEVAPLASDASFSDVIKGKAAFGDWAGDTLGNFAGQAIQSGLAGLAGAAVGGSAGSVVPGAGNAVGAVAGGVGGVLARGAVKRGIDSRVKDIVAKQIAAGAVKEGAEAAAETAVRQKLTRQLGGATLATTGLNLGQEVGIGYTGRVEDAAAEGVPLTQTDALRAFAYGVPAGLLDTVAEGVALGKLTRGGSGVRMPSRIARGAAAGALTEGGTEAAQAVLERAGAARELTGEEAYLDYLENAAAGALGGATIGGASGIRRPRRATEGGAAPPATPGSLEDAASAITRPAAPTTVAQPMSAEPVVTSPMAAPAQATAPAADPAQGDLLSTTTSSTEPASPVRPPWIDDDGNVVSVPDDAQVALAMRMQLAQQFAADKSMRVSTPQLAKAWGVDVNAVKRARTAVLRERAANLADVARESAASVKRGARAPDATITSAPWINAETGEITAPDSAAVRDALAAQMASQRDAGLATDVDARAIADAWQVPERELRMAHREIEQQRDGARRYGLPDPLDGLAPPAAARSASPAPPAGPISSAAELLPAAPATNVSSNTPAQEVREATTSQPGSADAVQRLPRAPTDAAPDWDISWPLLDDAAPIGAATGAANSTLRYVTERGSSYEVHDDGTTTRNKAARPEHPGDEGLQPRSQTTFYVDETALKRLGEFQAQGSAKAIVALGDGRYAVRYEAGKDRGKFERRTIVTSQAAPREGLYPVELWQDGRVVHFGNKIARIDAASTPDPASQQETTGGIAQPLPSTAGAAPAGGMVDGGATVAPAPTIAPGEPAAAPAPVAEPTTGGVVAPNASAPTPESAVGRVIAQRSSSGDELVRFKSARGTTVAVRRRDLDDPQMPALATYNASGVRNSGTGSSVLRADLRSLSNVAAVPENERVIAPATAVAQNGVQNIPESITAAAAPASAATPESQIGAPPAEALAPDRRVALDQRAAVDALPGDEKDVEIARLRAAVDQLQGQLDTDPLTGVRSRAAYERDKAAAGGVAIIDLKLFKGYNTVGGQTGGDVVLREFGQAMDEAAGAARAYRSGGDEFAFLAASPEDAAASIEALNRIAAEIYTTLEKDGVGYIVDGVPFTAGVGTDEQSADADLSSRKGDYDRNALPESIRRADSDQLGAGGGIDGQRSEDNGSGASEPGRADQPEPAAEPVAAPAPETNETPPNGGVSVSASDETRGDAPPAPAANDEALAEPAREGADIEAAAAEAATSPTNDRPEPTEAQKEAGNYAKGHLRINGLDVSIENPAGTSRRPEWPPLANHYGYIRRTEGADGDHVDVFLGDRAQDTSLPVFVIDQVDPKSKRFDEHKVILGAATGREARAMYQANYAKGWKGFGAITPMSWDSFKSWVQSDAVQSPASAELRAAAPPVPRARGGIAPNGARVRIVDGKPQYVVDARETLEAYFKPGALVPAYGGSTDKVIGFAWNDGSWSVRVQEQGKPAGIDGRSDVRRDVREHRTLPSMREVVKLLGPAQAAAPKAKGKAKTTAKPAAEAAPFSQPAAPARAVGATLDENGVRDVVNAVTSEWGSNGPSVRVVATQEQLPASAKRDPSYRTANGFIDRDGRIYLVASALRTAHGVRAVLAHEAVGHFGINKLVDDAKIPGGWKKLAADIARLRAEGLGSERMQAVLRDVAKRYPEADADTFARETLAVMAERDVRNGLIDRAIAAVRAFLRKIMPSTRFSEAELRQMLVRSDRFVRSGETYAQQRERVQAMAFSRPGGSSDAVDSFYSALRRSVEIAKGAPKAGSARQWKEWFDGAQRRGEFKGAERDWLGVDQWLEEQRGAVTRAQIAEFIDQNAVRLTDVVLEDEFSAADQRRLDALASRWQGWSADEEAEYQRLNDRALAAEEGIDKGAAKYRKYTIPGGGAYRELLMTLPHRRLALTFEEFSAARPQFSEERKRVLYDAWESGRLKIDEENAANFSSSHYDVDNILVHVRFNERVDADGKRALHIEEIQSDWHQEGRRRGYAEKGTQHQDLVPNAPMRQTEDWSLLGFKRALRWAAENDFDRVTWTTGRQQAERYDLRKEIGELVYWKDGEDWGVSASSPHGGSLFDQRFIKDRDLESELGKEVAERMRAGEGESTSEYGYNLDHGEKALRGDDLAVGGAGMYSFYDQMLPKAVQKYVKKWGGVVGTSRLDTGRNDITGSGDLAPERATVHAVDITSDMRRSVVQGQPLFSQPRNSVETLDDVLRKPDASALARAKEWLAGKWQDIKPWSLGWLTTRHLLELIEPIIPARHYAETMQRIAADRNELLEEYGALGTEAADWARKNAPEAKRLSALMNDATIAGSDPTKEYVPLKVRDSRGDLVIATPAVVRERIASLRGQMRGRPGEVHVDKQEEVEQLKQAMPREKARRAAYPGLVARFQQLSPKAQELFAKFRDSYQAHSDRVEVALQARIKALDVPETYKRQMAAQIRQQFEEARLQGIYFPLARNGDFWLSAQNADGDRVFLMFERFADYKRAERELANRGYKADAQGRRDGEYRAKDAPSGTFVADAMETLRKAGVSEKARDELYQLYLKTLPELSMRKHSIHRKKVAGYEVDHIRAYGKNMFHGAHQLARLRHAHVLQSDLEAMKVAGENRRKGAISPDEANRMDTLLAEMQKRHDWIMAPKDSALANIASSIGFTYYLGLTPAAALVNLTQGALTTYPVLGARHGFDRAARMLGAATRDAIRTGGNIERALTNDDERTALRTLRERGDIQRTAAHSLAGIAEGSEMQAHPVWARGMHAISFLFSKMEEINRQAAGLAAYRMARLAGDDHVAAIKYASEIINNTHFDFSNANRARHMQSSFAKIATMFKQYALNMSWLLYRNAFKAFKGETPAVQRQARRTLAGVLGMSALFSGAMGLPFMGVASTVAGALQSAFGDDDEPWDFDTEVRAFLAGFIGDGAARIVADGVVNELGADVANRVAMDQMWFRDADRELEGRDAYYHMMEHALGPVPGIAKNVFIGAQQMGDGQIWRGFETMAPKFLKDGMKAIRFNTEGANTLRGDPLIEDVSTAEQFVQLLGFSPTRMAEQYRVNRAAKNYEQHYLDRRQNLLNALALAVRMQDDELRTAALERIQAFNRAVPELALSPQSIRQSLRARARYSAQAEAGVVLNKRIADRVREQIGANN